MKAICVKYLPWTNTKPARLKAYIKGHHFIVIHDDRLKEKDVAQLLMDKLEWDDLKIIGEGTLPNEEIVFLLGAK